MTAETAPGEDSAAAPWEPECPVCDGSWLDTADGDATCGKCQRSIRVWTFRPPPARPVLPEGTGRCAVHPENDAAIDCERCGAFACDVCSIELDGQTFCPACVDLLHGRGELVSTRSMRMRWDYLALAVCAVSLCVSVTWPVALALGIYGLRRVRHDPWLSRGRLITVVVISGLFTVVIPLVFVVSALGGEL